jgi:fructose-bisphosphate aldolase class II
MVDASRENFPTNVALTNRVVEIAHACGVAVEGKLGYVAGEDCDAQPRNVVYTSVEEARVYAERTQVDCLAVSIGAVHGPLRGRSRLDCGRLKRIYEGVAIPLVIHGASGLSDEQIRRLVAYGVAKINHYTALSASPR